MSAEDIVLIVQREPKEFVAYHRCATEVENFTLEHLIGSNPPPFVIKPTLQEVINEVETLSPYPEYGYEFINMETVTLTSDDYEELLDKASIAEFLVGIGEAAEADCGG